MILCWTNRVISAYWLQLDRACVKAVTCFLIAAFQTGCTDHGKGPPPASAYVYDRPGFDDQARENAKSFQQFGAFAAALHHGRLDKVYEGLPHDIFERELFESEKRNKETIKTDGYDFYARPITVSPELTTQLRHLLTSKTSFVPFQGYKACGGFHPDWGLVWGEGSDSWTVLLCFGCSEMIVIKNGEQEIYCDIWDLAPFESLLNPLHTNRPKTP
jgi:hypothetical protein